MRAQDITEKHLTVPGKRRFWYSLVGITEILAFGLTFVIENRVLPKAGQVLEAIARSLGIAN